MRRFTLFLLGSIMLFTGGTIQAADLAREKRMADEIVDAILDGDPVYLEADGQSFLSIYTESDADDVHGTVIILHGRGFHPDWPDMVNPVRVGLIEYGWNTLSVQMPVLEKQAKYYDYVPIFPTARPRVDAAIAYARDQLRETAQPDQVVLVAHSCGAHMAMQWVDNDSIETIDAYIGLGMGATDYGQPMRQPFPLSKLNVPVLDVYGEKDYPAVLKMADERWKLISEAGNPASKQIIIDNADHYYTDQGDALTKRLADWLSALPGPQ